MPDVLKTVGRYEILREVGRGGMAMVYLARQTDLDRFVALKELAAFHASDPAFAQRFLRESRVAGSLSHPNIVTVHDYFEHDGTPYIAMEYIERGSLRPYVGSMSKAQIGGVLEGLLAGLAHAEQHGIVHRDLKPENLMVTADGRVKIADFGIAKATNQLQTGAYLTATGTTVGTPTYMAPEQAMAQEVGPWTDLYSVGCMAFELFTGRPPFGDSDAPMAILLRHVNEPIPPVASVDPSIDQGLSDWVDQLLYKDPKERTQSAAEAWDDLEEIIIGLLGPRWRRSARLLERTSAVDTPKPLTPAPFEGTDLQAGVSDEFRSFAWSAPGADAPPAAATPPLDAPAPEAAEAPPVEPADPEAEAAEVPPAPAGFVTFGAEPPAASPPAEAAEPLFATSDAPAPPMPTDALRPPPGTPEPESFETFNPPPPARPPEHEDTRDAQLPPREDAPAPEPAPADEQPPKRRTRAGGRATTANAGAAAVAADDLGATVMPEALKRAAAETAAPAPARRSRRFPLLLGAGVVAAVVAGAVLGSAGGGGAPSSETPVSPLRAEAANAKIPADYAALRSVPAVPGLTLAGAAAAAPGGRDGARAVTLGVAKADDPSLLPRALRRSLGLSADAVPERTAVKLGPDDLQAYRYEGLKPAGADRMMTVYASPTTAGVVTLACLAQPTDAGAFKPGCEAIANTLRLASGQPFPVGADPGYARTLGAVFRPLGDSVTQGRRALGASKTTFRAQARAAGDVATAYAGAAKRLSSARVGPAETRLHAALVARLGDAAKAWKRAAVAARGKDKRGFAAAGDGIKAAESRLAGAIRDLESAGYDVQT